MYKQPVGLRTNSIQSAISMEPASGEVNLHLSSVSTRVICFPPFIANVIDSYMHQTGKPSLKSKKQNSKSLKNQCFCVYYLKLGSADLKFVQKMSFLLFSANSCSLCLSPSQRIHAVDTFYFRESIFSD